MKPLILGHDARQRIERAGEEEFSLSRQVAAPGMASAAATAGLAQVIKTIALEMTSVSKEALPVEALRSYLPRHQSVWKLRQSSTSSVVAVVQSCRYEPGAHDWIVIVSESRPGALHPNSYTLHTWFERAVKLADNWESYKELPEG